MPHSSSLRAFFHSTQKIGHRRVPFDFASPLILPHSLSLRALFYSTQNIGHSGWWVVGWLVIGMSGSSILHFFGALLQIRFRIWHPVCGRSELQGGGRFSALKGESRKTISWAHTHRSSHIAQLGSAAGTSTRSTMADTALSTMQREGGTPRPARRCPKFQYIAWREITVLETAFKT